jgi:hypothetical protein
MSAEPRRTTFERTCRGYDDHDDWCLFYSSNNIADCDCNIVTRYVEPRRS